MDIASAKTLVPGDQVKSRVSGAEGTFSHLGPNPGGSMPLVWFHTDRAVGLWSAHHEDVVRLPGAPPVREGCTVLGRAAQEYGEGAAVPDSGEWVASKAIARGQWVVQDHERYTLQGYSHNLHAPLQNVQVPKKEETVSKETTEPKVPVGADFLPGDRIQGSRPEYTGTVLRVEGTGPLAKVWYAGGVWVYAQNATLLARRVTPDVTPGPFAVGERVRQNYGDRREATVTAVTRGHHDPNDWRVDYRTDDGDTEWDRAGALVPLTGGATAPAAPKAVQRRTLALPHQSALPEGPQVNAAPHQAALLLGLQQMTLACRGCGHIFGRGEEKRSVQKSEDGKTVTALCAHTCWPKCLRG